MQTVWDSLASQNAIFVSGIMTLFSEVLFFEVLLMYEEHPRTKFTHFGEVVSLWIGAMAVFPNTDLLDLNRKLMCSTFLHFMSKNYAVVMCCTCIITTPCSGTDLEEWLESCLTEKNLRVLLDSHEHEPAVYLGGQEGWWHIGLYQKLCGWEY